MTKFNQKNCAKSVLSCCQISNSCGHRCDRNVSGHAHGTSANPSRAARCPKTHVLVACRNLRFLESYHKLLENFTMGTVGTANHVFRHLDRINLCTVNLWFKRVTHCVYTVTPKQSFLSGLYSHAQ